MLPWNHWYHCTGSTYGTWLRGDARGWRARHHREHVDGDYRNPPPAGKYEELYLRSKKSMKRNAVKLNRAQRILACRTMAEALMYHNIELVDLCVSATHFHILARFTPLSDRNKPSANILRQAARRYIGIAKKNCSRILGDSGATDSGGIWAVRGLIQPIKDRSHQLNVVRYIRGHTKEDAAIWSTISKETPDQTPKH